MTSQIRSSNDDLTQHNKIIFFQSIQFLMYIFKLLMIRHIWVQIIFSKLWNPQIMISNIGIIYNYSERSGGKLLQPIILLWLWLSRKKYSSCKSKEHIRMLGFDYRERFQRQIESEAALNSTPLPGWGGSLLLLALLDCKGLGIAFWDLDSIESIFRDIFRR